MGRGFIPTKINITLFLIKMCIGVVAIAERNVGQTFQDMLVHTKTILDGSCVVIM